MATGDQKDIVSRLKALLPDAWFQGETPVLDALLSGIGAALAAIYGLTAYARRQTRIATATDAFLDLISFDFLGTGFPRKAGESDEAFRARIQAEILLERGTRKGMIRALEILTGRTPIVFEPSRPADTGGLNTGSMGLGVAGGLGSLALPYQVFVTAYRPIGQGIPYIAGLGYPQGALNTGSQTELASLDMIAGAVTDASIYATVDAVKEEGTIAWTRILS